MVLPFLITLVWLYTVIRSIAHPTASPTYGMFAVYLLFLGSSILQIGRLLYDHTVFSAPYFDMMSSLSHFLSRTTSNGQVFKFFTINIPVSTAVGRGSVITNGPLLLQNNKSSTDVGAIVGGVVGGKHSFLLPSPSVFVLPQL